MAATLAADWLHLALLHMHVYVPVHNLSAVLIQIAIDNPLVLLTSRPPTLFSGQLGVPTPLKEANNVRGVGLKLLVHQPHPRTLHVYFEAPVSRSRLAFSWPDDQ